MTLEQVKQDLEQQGFTVELEDTDEEQALFWGIGLNEGAVEVVMMAKITGEMLYVSTVNLIDDVDRDDLAYLLSLNDLIKLGKLFLSIDVIDEEVETQHYAVDYGFEILVKYYSAEMLNDYLEYSFSNLEDLIFNED